MQGTGFGGRIVSRDLLSSQQAAGASQPVVTPPSAGFTDLDLSSMRKVGECSGDPTVHQLCVYMCVCVCTCVYVCVHVYVCVCTCVYMCVYMCVCVLCRQ